MWEIPQLPEFPTFPNLPEAEEPDIFIDGGPANDRTLTLTSSKKFNTIEIKSDRKLTIDVGDTDKDIIVDELIIEQGHIILEGTAKLNIYVNDELRFGRQNGKGSSRLNENGDPNRLNIFVKGSNHPGTSKKISVQGNQWVYGSIFAEDADIDLLNSGRIYGNIFTYGKQINISGSGKNISQLILAPNADVSIAGSGSIYGMVISKTYSHPGNGTITFGQPLSIDGPISVETLSGSNGSSHGGSELIRTDGKPRIETISSIKEIDE